MPRHVPYTDSITVVHHIHPPFKKESGGGEVVERQSQVIDASYRFSLSGGLICRCDRRSVSHGAGSGGRGGESDASPEPAKPSVAPSDCIEGPETTNSGANDDILGNDRIQLRMDRKLCRKDAGIEENNEGGRM